MHAPEQAQKENFSEAAQCPVEDNKAFRDLKMVRYADDFIILTRTKEDAQNVLSDTESFLSTLGLKIKKEKTSIKPISEGFHFLGIRFEDLQLSWIARKTLSCSKKTTVYYRTVSVFIIEWRCN